MTYVERKQHVSRCPKNPLIATCRFCGDAINRRKGFREHMAGKCAYLPAIPAGHKICSGCQTVVPFSGYRPDGSSKDGLRSRCRPCHRADQRTCGKKPKTILNKRYHNLLRNYGVSREQFEVMLAAQGGMCAICHKPPTGDTVKTRHLHLDHCHATERNRGLLCMNCNHMIGKANEDPAILRSAIEYLERHQN
jgi:hypothetical protein